jgi:hypothetical protein
VATAVKKGIVFIAFLGSLWFALKMPIWLTPPLDALTPIVYFGIAWILLGLYLFLQPRQPFKNRLRGTAWTLFHIALVGGFAGYSLYWIPLVTFFLIAD